MKNWMLWVAIVIALLAAGYIIARLPVPAARGEAPAVRKALGTRPGNVGRGTPLVASGGDQLPVFAQG